MRKSINIAKKDLELIKSPCRDCQAGDPPGCFKSCEILSQVQEMLSETMSQVNSVDIFEEHEVGF